MEKVSSIVNIYDLVYNGNYQHSILLRTKQDITQSAIESNSGAVSEYLLRTIEGLENGIADKLATIANVTEHHIPNVRKIHQHTMNRWSQPRLSGELVDEMFLEDLMQKADKMIERELEGIKKDYEKEIVIET